MNLRSVLESNGGAGLRLAVCLAIVFVSSWVASSTQEAGGDVHVQSIKIPTQNGQWVVADWFRPRSATAESPAPFIAVVPGFQRSKEALSNIAIELARRGLLRRRLTRMRRAVPAHP